MYTVQKYSKCFHASKPHPTSPEGVGACFLDCHTLFSVGWGVCIYNRGLWAMLLINPGTPAPENGQKVTTLLSKCSEQTLGAGNKITLFSHLCNFAFSLFSIYTYIPQKGR